MRLTAATCLLLALACGDAASRWDGEVRVDGSLRAMMHEGVIGPAVTLDQLLPDAELYGVGALAGLAGELTVIGGEAYLSYPDGDAAALTTVHTESANGVALGVTTRVAAWESFTIEDAVPFEALEATIAELVEQAGHDLDGRIPFLLRGTFETLDWHVIDGSKIEPGPSSHEAHREAAARIHGENVAATLIGFYSRDDQGNFTHMGATTHIHAVVPEPLSAGHVDRVSLAPGATIELPRR